MFNELNICELKKISQSSQDILMEIKISNELQAIINKDLKFLEILELCLKKSLYPDAINLLAHGLPKRESIWWGYICTRQSDLNSNISDVLQVLKLVNEWVVYPNESLRRQIEKIPSKLAFKYPSAWLGMAVFWSGGNIAEENSGAQVLPNKYLYAKAVAGAIMLAAVAIDTKNITEIYKKFIMQGIDIANGGNGEI